MKRDKTILIKRKCCFLPWHRGTLYIEAAIVELHKTLYFVSEVVFKPGCVVVLSYAYIYEINQSMYYFILEVVLVVTLSCPMVSETATLPSVSLKNVLTFAPQKPIILYTLKVIMRKKEIQCLKNDVILLLSAKVYALQ